MNTDNHRFLREDNIFLQRGNGGNGGGIMRVLDGHGGKKKLNHVGHVGNVGAVPICPPGFLTTISIFSTERVLGVRERLIRTCSKRFFCAKNFSNIFSSSTKS